MVEYAYPECTTSVITSLSIFRQSYPSYRSAEISTTIKHAIDFLHSAQYPEGGWFGSWGICFTYATMFALESLSLVGETYETSKYAKKACDWLISKQRADGGWGESWKVKFSRFMYMSSEGRGADYLSIDLRDCSVGRA